MHHLVNFDISRALRISVWMSMLCIVPSLSVHALMVDQESDETNKRVFIDQELINDIFLIEPDPLFAEGSLPIPEADVAMEMSVNEMEEPEAPSAPEAGVPAEPGTNETTNPEAPSAPESGVATEPGPNEMMNPEAGVPAEPGTNETTESARPSLVEEAPVQELQGYNASARPFATGGGNVWVRGDALYWKASEDNLYYAYSGNNADGGRFRNVETVGFDWDWGFRLGIGYTIPRDRWDLALTWTHFHSESTSHASADSPDKGLFSNWWPVNLLSILGMGESAQGRWRPHLDQIDLSLGREFYVGRHLTLRPSAGLRNAWIDQQFNATFRTTTGDAITKMQNDFWGFGFFGGLDTKWKLGSDWHLFANGTAAIVYGTFDITQRGYFNRELYFQNKKDFQSGKGIVDIQAGIEWAHLFAHDHFGITIRAGYEYHLYADQSQFPLPTSSSSPNVFTPVGGDLAYQGLLLSGQFDF